MVQEATFNLGIAGMTCAACVGRVEKALQNVPGVASSSVNLATESAQICWSPGLDLEQAQRMVRRAVREAGYEPRVLHAQWAEPANAWQGFAPVALGLVLSFPLTWPMLASLVGLELQLPSWLQAVLSTIVQWVLGARFYVGAWHALKNRSTNMDVLVALGTSAAWGLSVWLWLTATSHEQPHLYFEGSAVIITLVMLGKWLEARIKRQTTAAIRALYLLRPQQAHLDDVMGAKDIPVEELAVGDVIWVRAGEAIPADGEILHGHSSVNVAMLTGEPLPVPLAQGDAVTGGSLNGEGLLKVRITAVGAQSVLARIIARVENAQADKSPIQRLVDRVSAVFVPVVVVSAVFTLSAWRWWGLPWEQALIHAVSVLVIACPCAMGLATPAALVAGTGLAARRGILIRDAQVLEQAQQVDTVLFDKTGTLTRGEPQVQGVWLTQPEQAAHAWSVALALQAASDHPLAKAVVAHAQGLGFTPELLHSVQVVPGVGVQGQHAASTFTLARLTAFDAALLEPAQDFIQSHQAQGATLSALVQQVGRRSTLVMLLAFADQLKDHAVTVVSDLQRQGVAVHLVSGDQPASVLHLAQQLGLRSSRCHAAMTPEGKASLVAELMAQGRQVAFVGDGINDAPALATAQVGMAMANAQGGSDVVMSTAGLTLLRGDLRLVPESLRVSALTLSKIRQNLFWAFAYNVAGIPLAALGLLNPMVAAAAMALSSVSVMTNAALLRSRVL